MYFIPIEVLPKEVAMPAADFENQDPKDLLLNGFGRVMMSVVVVQATWSSVRIACVNCNPQRLLETVQVLKLRPFSPASMGLSRLFDFAAEVLDLRFPFFSEDQALIGQRQSCQNS